MSGHYDTNENNFATMFADMYREGNDFNTKFQTITLANLKGSLIGENDSAKSFYNSLVNAIGTANSDGSSGGSGLLGRLGTA
jgi:hypothetical protein